MGERERDREKRLCCQFVEKHEVREKEENTGYYTGYYEKKRRKQNGGKYGGHSIVSSMHK